MAFLHLFLCLITIFSGFMVAFSKNPMNSIVFLILTFFNAFVLLYYFNIEFLGLLFVLIYVGAIAILFLFVIMMLNLKSQESNFLSFNLITKFFLVILFIYSFFLLSCIFCESLYSENEKFLFYNDLESFFVIDSLYNIDVIGQALFNYFIACFLVAGLILLVALLGAVILTFNFNKKKSGQLMSKQLAKTNNVLIFYKSVK